MTPEQTFEQLLGLGTSWKVVRTDYETERNTFVICVEETEALWPEESAKLGQPVSCYDHVEPMQWRHLNVFNKECVIVSALPRGRRSQDGAIYRVTPPWEGRSKHFSREFEAFALTLMREMPVKKAGEILGETDQRLWRALFAHVEAAWAELSWENVVWVGVDEMNRKKGHNYLTVFVDLQAKRVLLAVEGKDAGVWEQFAAELGNHNGHPKAITMVAIDMSPAYWRGVRENFGNAQIVFDKFHVVSQVVGAVEEVRRKEARQDARAREQLERTSWLWRKNPERWTAGEEARWEQLKDKPLVTGLAYVMRLELQQAYAAGTISRARRRFKSWCRWVRTEAEALTSGLLEPMRQAADMVERHLE